MNRLLLPAEFNRFSDGLGRMPRNAIAERLPILTFFLRLEVLEFLVNYGDSEKSLIDAEQMPLTPSSGEGLRGGGNFFSIFLSFWSLE